MKTYTMRVDSTPVVVKVYMRLPDEDLQVAAAELTAIWKLLSPVKFPNLLPYQLWVKSSTRVKSPSTPVYLIRQYFHANLYDRLSTRPFLNELEKLWLIFQLFKCLEICHEQDIVHGDIKPENIMVTTGNWLILTDFSPFKPAVIPDDDPTDFQYYFDSMGRHRCYIAPERFYRQEVHGGTSVRVPATEVPLEAARLPDFLENEDHLTYSTQARPHFGVPGGPAHSTTASGSTASLSPSVDVFSLGCIMAEVFLDGVPLLDLPAMLQYVSANSAEPNSGTSSEPNTPATKPVEPLSRAHSLHTTKNDIGGPVQRLDQGDNPAKYLLSRIKNNLIRNVILDMTQRDPRRRLNVTEYLRLLQGKPVTDDPVDSEQRGEGEGPLAAFPPYFEHCLYPLFLKLHWAGVSPDERIYIICESYSEIMQAVTGDPDSAGAEFFADALRGIPLSPASSQSAPRLFPPAAQPRRSSWGLDVHTGTAPSPVSVGVEPGAATNSTKASAGERGLSEEALCWARRRDFSHSPSTEQKGSSAPSLLRPLLARRQDGSVELSTVSGEKTEVGQEGELSGEASDTGAGGTSAVELLKRARELLREAEQVVRESAGMSSGDGKSDARAVQVEAGLLMRWAMDPRFEDEEILGATAEGSLLSHPELTPQKHSQKLGSTHKPRQTNEGLVLLVGLLTSLFRHLRLPQSRLVCLALLGRLGRKCTDSVILQRILPILLYGVEDPNAAVRAMALRVLRSLVSLVNTFAPQEAQLFPLYVFPLVGRLARDPEPTVRVAFAESLGRIAEAAKRFLDKAHLQALHKSQAEQPSIHRSNVPTPTHSGSSAAGVPSAPVFNFSPGPPASGKSLAAPQPPPSPSSSNPYTPGTGGAAPAVVEFAYDAKLDALREQVSRWLRDLMADGPGTNSLAASSLGHLTAPSAAVSSATGRGGLYSPGTAIKRVLLLDIMRLCVFFGQEAAMDKLLTQLLTFLNDQDWELRYTFCAKIPAVSAFLGPTVTAECILPCVENAIYDVEERVVLCSLRSLSTLVQLSLLSRFLLVDFVKKVLPLLVHPSDSLRDATIDFLVQASKSLGVVDSTVFLIPEIREALKYDLSGIELSKSVLKNTLVGNVARPVYKKALLERLGTLSTFAASTYASSILNSETPSNDLNGDLSEASDTETSPGEMNTEKKLQLLQGYIDHAAREINTKALQWRNGLASFFNQLTSSTRNAAGGGRDSSLLLPPGGPAAIPGFGVFGSGVLSGFTMEALNSGAALRELAAKQSTAHSLLDLTGLPLLLNENSVHSLLVPHQKFGVFYFAPLSEDFSGSRQQVFLDSDGFRNASKLKAIFGVTGSQSDAARTIGGGVGEQFELGTTSTNNPSHSAAVTAGDLNSQSDTLTYPDNRVGQVTSSGNLIGYVGSGSNLAQGNMKKNSFNSTRGGQAAAGAALLRSRALPLYFESLTLLKTVKALGIPPLPPDTGKLLQPTDHRPFSCYVEPLDTSQSMDAHAQRATWRPKEGGALLATLREHRGAVHRLCVSQDQSFFCSASADRTVKIWLTKNLDRAAFPRSAAMYTGHSGAVLDLAAVEDSPSIVSAGAEGALHVWRTDLLPATQTSIFGSNLAGARYSNSHERGHSSGSAPGPNTTAAGISTLNEWESSNFQGLSVAGTTVVRRIHPSEGAVVGVQHFNSDVCSVVTYATQKGGVHGWDLRSAQETMNLKMRPELGYPTCMTTAPDRYWICVGTSKGFIHLWDVRYNLPCKLWQHSSQKPINRMACCKSLRGSNNSTGSIGAGMMPQTDGAYLFVAAGNNEAAVWGIPEGRECWRCFRAVPLEHNRLPHAPLPTLEDIALPRHPYGPLSLPLNTPSKAGRYSASAFPIGGASLPGLSPNVQVENQMPVAEHTVRAVIGRISQSNSSYLITAGSDKTIRYWDFSSATRCFTVSGLEAGQPKGLFATPNVGADGSGAAGGKRLFVCYVASTPSADTILQAHLPIREGRGIALPSANFKDAILDMKNMELPMRLMLTSGRDGVIKLWR